MTKISADAQIRNAINNIKRNSPSKPMRNKFKAFTLITGGNKSDTLQGTNGRDVMLGGKGNDTISGGKGPDVLNGGSGNDTLRGGAGSDNINGGSGDDIINGDGGNDIIKGGAGDDTITAGSGKDNVNGGSGNDVVQITGRRSEFRIFRVDAKTVKIIGKPGSKQAGNSIVAKNVETLSFEGGKEVEVKNIRGGRIKNILSNGQRPK